MPLNRAVSERDRSEANRANTDRQVFINLKQSYADLESALDRVNAQREVVEAAEVRAQISRKKYATGLETFQDWDLIENDLITQQQMLLSKPFAGGER